MLWRAGLPRVGLRSSPNTGAAQCQAERGRLVPGPLRAPTRGKPARHYGTGSHSKPTPTRDLFLPNTVRLHRALRRAQITAQLHVFEAMPDGGFIGAPEDTELAAEVAAFVREQLKRA